MATIIHPTTPVNHIMPEATPSKKVSNDTWCMFTCSHHASGESRAAAALRAMSSESPTKPIHKSVSFVDDARRSPSPLSETKKAEDQELILRKCFVGDIDLPESTSGNCVSASHVLRRSGAAPHGVQTLLRVVHNPIS